MTKQVNFEIGKNFDGRDMKNMSLITTVIEPSQLLDKSSVASRRILVDDYPLFSNEASKEIREIYIVDCLATCVPLVVLFHDELPDHPVDVFSINRKRKPKSFGEKPSGSSRPPTKVARTYGLGVFRDTMRP